MLPCAGCDVTVVPGGCYRGTGGMLPWYRGDVTVVPLGCYRGTFGMLPWYLWNVTEHQIFKTMGFSLGNIDIFGHMGIYRGTFGMLPWCLWDVTVVPLGCYRGTGRMLPWYRGDVTVVRGGCYRAPGGVLPRAPGRPSPGKASRAPPMMSPHHSRSPSITEATCRAYMRSLPSMHDHGRKKT